jgi:hypothetical protein
MKYYNMTVQGTGQWALKKIDAFSFYREREKLRGEA